MAQYIDKSALVAWAKETYLCENASMIRKVCYKQLLEHLNTLEVKEVDLEKEVESWRHNHFNGRRDKEASGEYLERVSQLNLAKHFFELGLNTQHSSINISNIDDTLKKEGLDPDSKEAKVFKESYYMALEKLKAQKG